MRVLFTGIIVMLSLNLFAQQAFEISKDSENGSTVFKGKLTFRDLEQETEWFKPVFKEYKPDTAAMNYLKQHIRNYRMVVFLGTWCEDSQSMIPKIFRIFIDAYYTGDKYETYGVDRAKTSLKGEHKTYGIKFVPTVIVYDGNKEIGRIVENVHKSVEEDLVSIIKKSKGNN